MSDLKPAKQMDSGRQYADNPYGQDNYICTNRDSQNNEIPESSGFHHEGTTPGAGSSVNYSAKHYNDDVKSGTAVKDMGQSPSKETVGVDVHAAGRGSES